MTEKETKQQDTHGTPEMTHWVHKHRRLAKWLFKLLIAGVASLLYYLRRQEKDIEKEVEKDKK